MESLLASSEDHLLPHLDYKLENTASYIESRHEVTSFSSVPIASPDGVKVLPFQITSDSFIDPSSVFFILNLNNLSQTLPLHPLTTGPHGLIQRLILTINGQIVADCQYYNRLHEESERLQPAQKRANNADTGFGYSSLSTTSNWVVAHMVASLGV